MKKHFIILFLGALMALGTSRAMAQSFNAGLTAGATFCQVDGDSYYGFHQLGFTAGAFVNLPLIDHLSAQVELKYSLFGAHSSTKEVTEYNYNPYSLRLHYAEIPVMLRYDLGIFRVGGRPLDFIILEAGASVDVRLRATEDVDTDYQVTTNRWNALSATANVGLGVAIGEHLEVGARFMYSVAPCRFSASPGWFFGQYYNKVIQLTLSYNLYSPLR